MPPPSEWRTNQPHEGYGLELRSASTTRQDVITALRQFITGVEFNWKAATQGATSHFTSHLTIAAPWRVKQSTLQKMRGTNSGPPASRVKMLPVSYSKSLWEIQEKSEWIWILGYGSGSYSDSYYSHLTLLWILRNYCYIILCQTLDDYDERFSLAYDDILSLRTMDSEPRWSTLF